MAVNDRDYQLMCRLCATKTNGAMGVNIFEREGSVRQLPKKISKCLPVQVDEADRLPKIVCQDCLFKLDMFYSFQEKSRQTEIFLIDLVKELNCSNSSIGLATDLPKLNLRLLSGQVIPVELLEPQLTRQMLADNAGMQVIDRIARQDSIMPHDEQEMMQSMDLNSHSLESLASSTALASHSILTTFVDNADGSLSTDNMERLINIPLSHSDLTVDNLSIIQADSDIIAEDFEEMASDELKKKIIDDSLKANFIFIKTDPSGKYNGDHPNSNDDSNVDNSSDPDFNPADEDSTEDVAAIHDDDASIGIQDGGMFEHEKQKLLDHADEMPTLSWLAADPPESADKLKAPVECIACPRCSLTFDSLDMVEMHLKMNHEELNIGSLKQEDARYDSLDDKMAKDPIEVVEMDNDDHNSDQYVFKCLTCNETFPSQEDLMQHESSHLAEEDEQGEEQDQNLPKRKKWSPKVCKECGKSYKTNYKLAEHMRKHTGEQPYKCGTCDKAFRSKIGLAQHEAKHTGQYDFACPTCGKGFQCKSYLIVHQRVHSDLKPFPCTTCNRNFKTKQSLLDHMNRHLGVKPYMCDICGRGFITKGLCKSHQKVHSGTDNRQYPCNVCNKMFVSKSYLATHRRIHTGEKPFMCEVCGKGFLTRVDLRIHSTMHTGEKSFVCEMCGKAFARRDALRCHRRSHTGERPYRCDVCGQTFTQFSPMAIHKRLHTGERPYSCEVCAKTFVSRSTMMAHLKKHKQ